VIISISFEQIGLLLEIIGVLIVLVSNAFFWYKARKFGGMIRKFMKAIGPVRIGAGETEGLSDGYLKKTFPELWDFAYYLSGDILITTGGLVVTLAGLILELSKMTLSISI
jgi:hypothetical protein